MPAKKKHTEERTAAVIEERTAAVALPDGYDGPAYQTPDGKIMYVGKYLNRIWAILTFKKDEAPSFTKSIHTFDETKARAAFSAYAETQNWQKIQ